MNKFLPFYLLLYILFTPEFLCAGDKEVIGWVEKVRIYPYNTLTIKAKIDTGAKTSSINAPNVVTFERDGITWVRFHIPSKKGKSIKIEKEVVRTVKIKEKEDTSNKRPVIKLGVCLGNVYKEAEVNLVDRSNFIYPMLIGRSFLAGHFVIDPSSKYIKNPNCKEPKGK